MNNFFPRLDHVDPLSHQDKVDSALDLIEKLKHWIDAVESALTDPNLNHSTKTPRVLVSTLNARLQPLLKDIETSYVSMYIKENRM